MKSIVLLAGVALASTASAADYQSEKDVPYLGAGREQKLDVYQPPATFPRPAPAVVWIHGGSWSKGDKADPRELNVCQTLAENGYVAISINYQLFKHGAAASPAPAAGDDAATAQADLEMVATPGTVPWPQNLYDCKSALRYVRQEAARLGVDPKRIAISGGSAGGHLALLTGLTADDAALNKNGLYTGQSNQVACIVDFYGPTEVGDKRRTQYFAGATPDETKANVRTATVLTHLEKNAPPVLIVHGTKDPTVKISNSHDLAAALQKLGVPHLLIEVPGAGHAFHFQPKEMDLRPAVLEFLGKYLGKPVKTP